MTESSRIIVSRPISANTLPVSGTSTATPPPAITTSQNSLHGRFGNRKRECDAPSKKQLESAVYSYIQALRALGKNDVNTSDIADALGLRTRDVNSVLDELKAKGVKAK